ncbi:MAG: hypothetical protein RL117_2027 [Verrucomicrobiota bacterium]|jgi:hypothetical protein
MMHLAGRLLTLVGSSREVMASRSKTDMRQKIVSMITVMVGVASGRQSEKN